MLRVAAYTSGRNIPSARFRLRQYIPELGKLGVEVREHCARFGSSPPCWKALRPLWGAATVSDRIVTSAQSYRADVTLLQKEMVSTLVTAEPLTRKPRVLDVDDAIWLRRDGLTAQRLAGLCESIICGNEYLAEHFARWNPNVRVLPTAVDTDRFAPGRGRSSPEPLPYGRDSADVAKRSEDGDAIKKIGWSGESSNFRYLEPILPAVRAILDKRKDVVFRVVSEHRPKIEGIAPERIEFIRWSPENEVRVIQEMSVGIMPLDDTPWARGKCSFKLLTYMACGIPVVASPVGMNIDVLAKGGGYAPLHWEDWAGAIEHLLANETAAEQMSCQGRQAVLSSYSLRALAPRLAQILESCRN